ncbi:two-component response regulator ARR14-like [Solanum dulcamara]|uniref:two-component response regulator ARR14-like n=1 Tax=Solanum dulcamara TaxID=45834 RepID=UPI002484F7B8|nr:two-component response regulator ARR14-like [Solanum dulcamara]
MEVEIDCCDNEFTEKISILVVDDDINCLLITSDLLKKEKYKVVTVKNANDALSMLRASGNSFDLVITDVHMPDMNAFQLQQQITKEFDIPVVFMSDDDETECTTIKGLESGGVYFILKPISQDDIRDLWQYTIMQRKKKKNILGKQVVVEENINEKSPREEIVVESSSSVNEESYKSNKSKRKNDMAENQHNVFTQLKKSKLIWTEYLHNKFLEAITILGLKRAIPRRILEVMNIPELTRENVASHLQKYRAYLRKVTTPTNTNSEFISNSSKIIFGSANQLSTREATNPISTSAQQLMTEDLNSVTAHDTNFESIQEDKMLADILTRHIRKKNHNMLDNIYPTSNSTMHKTSVFNSQLNVQSSIVENNNIEEETILSFVDDGSNQYQQTYFPWVDHTLTEKQNYEGVTTEERSFQFHNSPLNSKLELLIFFFLLD